MYISEIGLKNKSGHVCAEAKVTWEESNRAPMTLFFETDAEFEDAFWADPDGFLATSLLPAWHAGEKRVKIDGSLCPVLCSNLKSATMMLGSWYPELGTPPAIEPSHGFKAIPPFQDQAAVFMSCGIDSLATLRWNKLNLPNDHPDSIRAAIPIDFVETQSDRRNRNRLMNISRVTADVGAYTIPMKTNVLCLDDDGWFFTRKWHGGLLGAVGYFLSRRFSKFYIASSASAAHLGHWGSDPLLDSWYSSAHVRVEHHGIINMSRLERTEFVADWPVGLQNVIVCQNSNGTNCGTCEKCIRTMTALDALGKLEQCQSFPVNRVTPELLNTLEEYGMHYGIGYYRRLIPLFEKLGRDDLVNAIEQLSVSRAQKAPKPDLTEQDIADLIPPGNAIILANERRWGRETAFGHSAFYWGPPGNNDIAILELETLRKSGAKFIVFRKPVFWWFDKYSELNRYLLEKFTCVLRDDRAVIFDLRENSS